MSKSVFTESAALIRQQRR